MSKSAAFKAACMGATLATAWTAAKTQGATDYQLTADCNLAVNGQSVTLSHLTFISGSLTLAVPDDSNGVSAISGQAHWGGTLILHGVADDLGTKPWALVGLGTGPLAGDMVVAFSDITTQSGGTVAGSSFETVFSTSPMTEAQLVDSLRTGGSRASVDVRNFLAAAGSPVTQAFGSSSHVMQFSNGVDIGTVSFSLTAVPEPGSMAMIATTVAALFRRKSRTKM